MLAGKIGRELTLRNALREPKRRYEVILIDCPPTLGLLTVNALVAADRAILSTQAEHFSEQGAEQAMEVIGLARENLNPDLELLGLLLNIADMRTNHARTTLETMREQFGDLVFDTVIRRSIVYPESAKAAKPIFDYRRRKAVDYASLTVEVLERLDFPAALAEAKTNLAELEPS
ncbi:MAG: ParA family protein, partial [Thermoleophilales bacterium]|nr:ParA family protein [Thermoleophilales bacterium]